jgi:hypothetical protein
VSRRHSDERISHTETIVNNTRIVRPGSAIHEALELLGWETLEIRDNCALVRGPLEETWTCS